MQPILIVEGTDASKTVSDRKLYRALHPGFDRVSIVPGGGRGECIKLLEVLGSALQAFSPAIKAVALLDRDLSSDTAPAGVTYIPVSMIENFLLDPDAIWESMQSVIEKTAFNAVEDISAALDVLLDGMTDDEVARRTLRALGVMVFVRINPLMESLARRRASELNSERGTHLRPSERQRSIPLAMLRRSKRSISAGSILMGRRCSLSSLRDICWNGYGGRHFYVRDRPARPTPEEGCPVL